MRRRTFIKTTGAMGLSAAMPWGGLAAEAAEGSSFLEKKSSDRMLFPRPHDGAEVDISPVGLAWLPCPSAADYRVEIFDAGGSRVYSNSAGKDPVHCPDRVLAAGRYTWDVVAYDSKGGEIARRGGRSFTIRRNAAELPWIEPKELLGRVPKEHPRVVFPKRNLESIRSTLNTTRARSWSASKAAANRTAT